MNRYLNHTVEYVYEEKPGAEPFTLPAISVKLRDRHENIVVYRNILDSSVHGPEVAPTNDTIE